MSGEYNEYAIFAKYYRYVELARNGDLPAGFDQWELAGPTGLTVAHEAAHRGFLPADFSQWGLVDNGGWTVAHAAAREGHLPADFNQWTLADNDGWTVAHTAATYGHLPDNFDQWGLSNDKGLTVLGYVLRGPRTQSDKFVSRWGKEGPLCKTDTDWSAFKTALPEIYQRYTVSGCMLNTDSDQEALREALQGASQGALQGASQGALL